MPMERGRQASSGPRSPSPDVHVARDGGRAPQRGASPSQTTGFQPGHARSSAGQTTAGTK